MTIRGSYYFGGLYQGSLKIVSMRARLAQDAACGDVFVCAKWLLLMVMQKKQLLLLHSVWAP